MSLEGRSVLVIDDDFLLAMDACATLEEAGAEVIGPFGRVEHALTSLQDGRPDAALVDLNLGSGVSFELVRALIERGVPTLIVTGYDKQILPTELENVPCLQKPVEMSGLISAVQRLVNSSQL